jgi:flagellar basal body-associated protein FliL
MNSERYEFKSIAPPKKKPNKERRYGLVVALLILILVFGAVVFATAQVFLGGSRSNFVDVPVIRTHLVSAEGNLHMFGTRVVIELLPGTPEVDPALLYAAVSAAVNSLDYEDITDFYGMENLRNAVRSRLSGSFNEEQLLGVYFAQFLSDMPLPNLEEETVPGRNPLYDMFLDN